MARLRDQARMVASIQSNGIAQGMGAGGAGTDDSGSVALQAQLTRCQKQLGDWEGCTSSKTPEGRKIIANLRNRIRTLESQMVSKAKSTTARAETDVIKTGSQSSGVAQAQQAAARPVTTLGSLLNVYA